MAGSEESFEAKMSDWEKQLRQVAADLISSGEVALVLGYGRGTLPERTRPVFLTQAEEAEALVYNEKCCNNLVVYLPRLVAKGKVAVVCRPDDVRTLVSLIQEKQLEREQVHVIALAPDGLEPPLYDTLIKAQVATDKQDEERLETLAGRTPEERWQWFQNEMAKCIRCYACRNACPMCYCSECFVERSVPRWVGEGANLSDTMIFHITRAMHAAGRCGECGTCVEACPMGVDLALINQKINSDVLRLFGHKAGMEPEAPAALSTFDLGDYNDFIK